jgi:bifunctional non-homologous end joining protein LigD
LLEQQHPDLVVSDMKKVLRTNKVFVDWSQNDSYKTTVNVYSLRAKDQPTVSTPVTWKEVEECLSQGDPELLVFTADQVLQRVKKLGDLFEPVLKLKQKLPKLEALEVEAEEVTRAKSAPAGITVQGKSKVRTAETGKRKPAASRAAPPRKTGSAKR